jgi:hypothetical protein
MTKKNKRRGNRWSMKTERELITLARTHTLEALADKLQHPSTTIRKVAKRLGLSIKGNTKTKTK